MRHPLVQKKKSWFRSLGITALLVASVIGATVSVAHAFMKQREAIRLRDQYQRELGDLQDKEASLQGKIEHFSHESGVEAEIRNRYRVVKPGEALVVVVDNQATSPEIVSRRSWWDDIRDFVGW
jgi:cell division protein FtsB